MSTEFIMSNDELAKAIEETHWMVRGDSVGDILGELIVEHLKELLSIQINRANQMSIE